MRLLVAEGADVNVRNAKQETVLERAIGANRREWYAVLPFSC